MHQIRFASSRLCTCIWLLLHRFKISIRLLRIENLIAVHNCHQVLSLGEVDDVVGVAGVHVYGLDIVATYFVIPYFIGSFFTHLNESMTRYNNKGFPFAMVPMYAFGNARFADVDAYLSAIKGMQ